MVGVYTDRKNWWSFGDGPVRDTDCVAVSIKVLISSFTKISVALNSMWPAS